MRTTITCLVAVAILAALPLLAGDASTKEEEGKQIAILQGNGPQAEKDQACRRLAVVGTKDAIPALAAMLSDEKMCDVARFGLAANPDPAVDEALRAAMGKLKGRQLQGVVMSLGNRRCQAATDDIAKLLGDADADTVKQAARALSSIGGPAAWKALEQALGTAPEAVRPDIGDAAIALADALLVQDKRDEALPIFERIRSTAALPKRQVAAAFRGVVLAKPAAGIPLVVEQLKADDKDMRRIVYRLARELPGSDATKALAAALAKLPQDRQLLLIQALGDRRDVSALPAMLEVAKSGEVPVRVAAIRTLGQLADASIVPMLFAATTDAQGDIAKAAQTTLAGLPDTKEVNEGIVAVAETGEAKLRKVAIDTIADRRIASAVPALVKAAANDDEQLRNAAIRALGEVSGVADLEVLTTKLAKPRTPQEVPAVEGALSEVFRRTEDKQACATKLLAVLPQAEGPSKCAVLRLLRVVGGAEALTAVRAAAKDANAEVKDTATRALFDWPTAEPAAEVLEMAKNPPTPVYAILALRGYVRMIGLKEVPAEKKPAMCTEAMALAKTPDLKKQVLAGLGDVAHPDALKLIEGCLEDAAVKAEAEQALLRCAKALAATNPDEARAALQKLIAATGRINIKKEAEATLRQLPKPKTGK